VGLKLNGTHQLLAYAGDVNLLGDNIDTIKKNMEALIDASKEVGLEINVVKTNIIYNLLFIFFIFIYLFIYNFACGSAWV
jgi:hypothetical protein